MEEVLGETKTLRCVGIHSSLSQEGGAARKELMMVGWIPLKSVFVVGAVVELCVDLPSGSSQ